MKKLLLAIPLLLSLAAVAYVVPSRSAAFRTAAAGGLSKTSLVAWYDLADATDAHASYDLTENGTPSYVAGPPSYAVLENSPQFSLVHESVDDGWPGGNADATYVIRFRVRSPASGESVFYGHNGGDRVRWYAGSATLFKCLGVEVSGPTISSSSDWYTCIVTYDSATTSTTAWVNGTQYGPTSGTYSGTAVRVIIGSSSVGFGKDFDVDYVGLFNRELTSDERTWLYNSGGTRTYSELSP